MTISLAPLRRRAGRTHVRRSRRRGTFSPISIIFIVALGAGLGLASAWWAIESGFGLEKLTVGSWTSWPTAGRADADPYLRARLARSGELTLSGEEGVVLTARTDSAGAPILSSCVYRIAGKMPPAQWWTLTAYRDGDLSLMQTEAQRTSYRSDLVLREPDGSVVVTVSPRARGGNWLPVDPDAGAVRLVLRLFDTPLSTGGKLSEANVPAVERVSCE